MYSSSAPQNCLDKFQFRAFFARQNVVELRLHCHALLSRHNKHSSLTSHFFQFFACDMVASVSVVLAVLAIKITLESIMLCNHVTLVLSSAPRPSRLWFWNIHQCFHTRWQGTGILRRYCWMSVNRASHQGMPGRRHEIPRMPSRTIRVLGSVLCLCS